MIDRQDGVEALVRRERDEVVGNHARAAQPSAHLRSCSSSRHERRDRATACWESCWRAAACPAATRPPCATCTDHGASEASSAQKQTSMGCVHM